MSTAGQLSTAGAKRKANSAISAPSNGSAAKRNKTLPPSVSVQGGKTPILPAASSSANGSDTEDDDEPDSPVPKGGKRGRRTRVNKGLRHFSVKVCEKLENCSVTTYNEIANLLVKDFMDENKEGLFDEKNIRRRIYDALNVLMAMDIIQKEKKEIRWVGVAGILEQESDPTPELLEKKAAIQKSLEAKKQQLEEMTLQFIALRNLMDRNARPDVQEAHKDKLHLPFIIVKTKPSTDITCEMNDARERVNFTYSDQFEIHDDQVVLKKIILQESSKTDVRAYIPSELQPYLPSLFPTHPKSINKLSSFSSAAPTGAASSSSSSSSSAARRAPTGSLYGGDSGFIVTSHTSHALPLAASSSSSSSAHEPDGPSYLTPQADTAASSSPSPSVASSILPLPGAAKVPAQLSPTTANPDAAAAAALTALSRAPTASSVSNGATSSTSALSLGAGAGAGASPGPQARRPMSAASVGRGNV